MDQTDHAFLDNTAEIVAPQLLGCILERTINNETIRVKIVETEAYTQTDAASHSYKGKTPRTDIMFGPAGFLYVYFTYGMHFCCNIVTDKSGTGSAVLIRAVEPLDHTSYLEDIRKQRSPNTTNGPAKLCQALSIDKSLNGHKLQYSPLKLIALPPLKTTMIVTTTRIGISKAKDKLWRFYIKDNTFVSKL